MTISKKAATSKIGSVGLPRMKDGEFERVKLECKEQKNFQISRQLRNEVTIEKIRADGTDLQVEIQGEKYKQITFQLQGERIQTQIESVKTETKAIELEGADNTKYLTRQRVTLELERGKAALTTLSLDIDLINGNNAIKQERIENLGAEIVSRISLEDVKKRLFGN